MLQSYCRITPTLRVWLNKSLRRKRDEFSNIDLVVTTKDGRTVYVSLALVIFGWGHHNKIASSDYGIKFKGGLFNNHDVYILSPG